LIIDNFDIATNLKVEMFIPIDITNPFILGVSLMGGNDVLDGDLNPQGTFAWVPIECEVSNCQISIGGSVDSNIFFQPESGQLNITMQTFDYDPSINSSIRAGTEIRIRLVDGASETTLFKGFVDTINVDYYVQGTKPNLINIKAFDKYKRFVNTRLATFDTTTLPGAYATPLEVLTEAATEAGYVVSALSDNVPGALPKETRTDAIASTFVNDAVQVGLGIIWVDQETGEIVIVDRPTTTTAPAGTYTIGNNHGDPYHLCMSDIQVYSDADAVYNSLKVSMTTDPATSVVYQDEGSIALYGETSTDIEINAYDINELNRWATHVFTSTPTKLVRSVETPAIDRLGDLTEAALFTPGMTVGVKYDRPPLDIDAYYVVVKVSHSIDVNNWFTTLDLWKGQ
jgi:hypothetical protein